MTDYTTLNYSRAKFRALSRQLGHRAADLSEHTLWRDRLRGELREILGINSMTRAPLNPRVLETAECDGFTRERVVIDTEPGVSMPLFVLLPHGERKNLPAVIAPHGHGSGGKDSVAGNAHTKELADTIAQHNYAYGARLAREGFLVFCPDARGFGERQEEGYNTPANQLGGSCYSLNMIALSLGQSLAGQWTFDNMRLIDYIETRPEADAARIGCAGLSGGGLQTLWLTALDDRVKAAVSSGYFYGVDESLLVLSRNCACNYVPHLWEKADMGDLGALIAPRPFCVESGDEDGLNGESGLANVAGQLDITRRAYRLYGAEANLAHFVFHGPHMWHGQDSVPWLKANL